jgi:K+-sensing histidine kinase KdpD
MEPNPTDTPASFAIGAGVAIAAAFLLVPLRDVIDNANVALALVMVIVLCGFFGGRWAGAGAAIGAAVSFDFLHTQPYLELRIKSSDDIVTTALLLAIGLVAGQIAVLARRRKRVAVERHGDVERVWRVAELAAQGGDPDDLVSAVRAELLSLLQLSECTFTTDQTSSVPTMAPKGNVPKATLRYQPGGFELPAEGVALRVHVGERVFGHLVCTPMPAVGVSDDQRHVAVVLADQLALALAARSRPSTTS